MLIGRRSVQSLAQNLAITFLFNLAFYLNFLHLTFPAVSLSNLSEEEVQILNID